MYRYRTRIVLYRTENILSRTVRICIRKMRDEKFDFRKVILISHMAPNLRDTYLFSTGTLNMRKWNRDVKFGLISHWLLRRLSYFNVFGAGASVKTIVINATSVVVY